MHAPAFFSSVRCCRVAPGRNQPISLAAAGAPFSSAPVEAAAAAFVADARLFAPAESVAAASAPLFSQRAGLRLCSHWWRRCFLRCLLLGRGSYITASWSGLRLRLWLIDAPSRLH